MLRPVSALSNNRESAARRLGGFAAFVCAIAGSAFAQGTGNVPNPLYDVHYWTQSCGGGTSAGCTFSVAGSIGEGTVGPMASANYNIWSGFVPDAGPSCAPTDLNCDGRTDGGDIAVVLLNWGQCPCGSGCEGDIDQNGYVDAGDIALISLDWQG